MVKPSVVMNFLVCIKGVVVHISNPSLALLQAPSSIVVQFRACIHDHVVNSPRTFPHLPSFKWGRRMCPRQLFLSLSVCIHRHIPQSSAPAPHFFYVRCSSFGSISTPHIIIEQVIIIIILKHETGCVNGMWVTLIYKSCYKIF